MSCEITINGCCRFSIRSTWRGLSVDDVLSKAEANGISIGDILSIDFAGCEIELRWGAFFKKSINVKQVSISATDRIKLNCDNFAESSVEKVHLSAPLIWFNDGVFMNATMLRSVVIHGEIIDGQHGGFSELTFKNCNKLEYVEGSYHGSKIMPCAFENCKSLTRPIDFYVTDLGYHTFSSCDSLKNIHLHNGLLNMGSSAFAGCGALEDIYIPDTVCDLGYGTFEDCYSLKKIHLPTEITLIGDSVFKNCVNLRKVFLPDSLTKIGNSAFENCRQLQKPYLPDGLLSIGKKAFWGCAEIKEMWIPQSVTSIGDDAFGNCPGLVIHGKNGSAAEKYAIETQITFFGE